MADIVEMKQAGKGTIDQDAARTKAEVARGAALATMCVRFAEDEARADEARGVKRMRYVIDIANLTHAGHAEFRKELQNQLAFMTEIEQGAVKAGALAEEPSRHGGYSSASYRVMVSNWRTISVACELGFKPIDDDGQPLRWETALEGCRSFKKLQATSGKTVAVEGTRKAGAGRKALTDYDKALRLVTKLDKKDQKKLLVALAGILNMEVSGKATVH